MSKHPLKSTLYITLSILLAIVCYVLFPKIFTPIAHFISDLFIRMLKLLSLPVIFLSIFTTFINITDLSQARKILKKVVTYTFLTTLIAACVGLCLFLIIHPAHKISTTVSSSSSPEILQTYLTFIKNIIPSNITEAFLQNNVLGVGFLATILGLSSLNLEEKEKQSVKTFFNALFKALLKISSFIIRFLPVGIFAFTIELAEQIHLNNENLFTLFDYALCVILANIVQGVIVLPLFLKSKKVSPLKAAKAMLPALSMAFFSKSSSATLPLTIELAKKKLHVKDSTASFSLPLCSVINMNGCAAFILITVLFVSMSSGVAFSTLDMIPWIFIASLMAIGNAGVPMGCYFLTSAVLIGMNVPLTLLGMILPLYTFFDMIETSLNVWSDSCVTVAVNKDLQYQEKPSSLT